jgi:uncharacterized membrane protein
MTFLQRAGGQIAWLILSLLGIGIAAYLTAVHYQGAPLVCSTTGLVDCENVLASAYSRIPGTAIPITFPGLAWFVVSGVLALVAWRLRPDERRLLVLELIWAALGILTVFYLVYVEIVRLHKICAWCTGIHVIILVMLLIAVVQWQGTTAEDELEEDEEKASSLPIKQS